MDKSKSKTKSGKAETVPVSVPGWEEEAERLRTILLGCGLTEERKWDQPCFTIQGKNVAVIIGLKEHCALMFFKGALLGDDKSVLMRIGKHTQAKRWIKFASVGEIVRVQAVLKAYIHEAIDAEKSGVKVKMKTTSDFTLPEELQTKFDKMPALKEAFDGLTPGRQRAYLYYISGAKQSKTREARIETCVGRILDGMGLND